MDAAPFVFRARPLTKEEQERLRFAECDICSPRNMDLLLYARATHKVQRGRGFMRHTYFTCGRCVHNTTAFWENEKKLVFDQKYDEDNSDAWSDVAVPREFPYVAYDVGDAATCGRTRAILSTLLMGGQSEYRFRRRNVSFEDMVYLRRNTNLQTTRDAVDLLMRNAPIAEMTVSFVMDDRKITRLAGSLKALYVAIPCSAHLRTLKISGEVLQSDLEGLLDAVWQSLSLSAVEFVTPTHPFVLGTDVQAALRVPPAARITVFLLAGTRLCRSAIGTLLNRDGDHAVWYEVMAFI